MPKVSTKEGTRSQLLEAGMSIMLEKGYNHTGIMEVLQTVGVPKGSFYYYFESKEDFGLQIINHFDELYTEKLTRYLGDTSKSPKARLRAYCDQGLKSLEEQSCRKGCLLGKLSQEMSEQSEIFRTRLAEVMQKHRNMFIACIREGQQLGELPRDYDPEKLAEFFLCAWEGSIMRAKTTRCTEPQEVFINLMFDHVFNA